MIKDRLRIAREFERLTQSQLAERAGVSRSAIGDIEAGRRDEPSGEFIEAVAAATGFPIRFFTSKHALPDIRDGRFRQFASGSAKDSKRIRAHARVLSNIIERASQSVQRLPHLMIQQLPPVEALDEVENTAAMVRDWLDIGSSDSIPNMVRAVERAGIFVARIPIQPKGFDSYSAWPEAALGGRPLIVLTDGHPGDRDRFSVGHELLHLILHTGDISISRKDAESQAHRFAGALLLPRSVAKKALRQPLTLPVLMSVKASYGISMAAAARRALDLGYITPAIYISLQKQLSNQGWRKEEPVEVPLEQPLLLFKALEAMTGVSSAFNMVAHEVDAPEFWLDRVISAA